jgi:tetratricopeptide (TPR) repeat protein
VRLSCVASLALLAFGLHGAASAEAQAGKPSSGSAATTAPAPGPSFAEVAQRAASARETDVAEALRWYRQGVQMRPSWEEGWWYLGSLSYSTDRYAESRDAFVRFVALKPEAGPAWALMGLSEFRLQQYDEAERHLSKGMALGSVGNGDIRKVVYYHFALLRIRSGQFELAMDPLQQLARGEGETPALLDACGLVGLRDARLPAAIPDERRELVRAAGGAVFSGLVLKTDEMRTRFDALLERYPAVPNLHYSYGLFLKDVDAEKAIAAHEREVAVQPDAVLPRLQLAFAHETNGQYDQALPWAEAALKLAPRLFAAHYALGRALVGLGQPERGVLELEEARRLAAESPEVRFALMNAYAAVGRTADAERERESFRKLMAERKGPSDLPGFARDLTAPSAPAAKP